MATCPPASYCSRAASFTGFGELARSLGRDPLPMLKRHKLPIEVMSDPELLVPSAHLNDLLESCAREWDCPDFGLRLGGSQRLEMLGPIGLVARLSENVGDALHALCNHLAVHSTGVEVTVDAAPEAFGRQVAVAFAAKPGTRGGRQIHELSLAVIRNVIAVVCGEARFVPDEVRFTCEAPADVAPVRRHFGCTVRYQQEISLLLFPRSMLTRKTAIHDPAMEPVIRAFLNQVSARAQIDIVEQTRRLIGNLLATGRCTQQLVAECLAMHPRTLQRHLAVHGATFSDLLDEHRRLLALDLVTRGSMPLARIADVLGYADQSVFNQAFRRWTCSTPRRFAAQAT